MKRSFSWIVTCVIVVLALTLGVLRLIKLQHRRDDPNWQIAEQIYKVQNVLKEVDADSKCRSLSKVTPFTYSDLKGNTIVYYCCQTVYISDEPEEYSGLNTDAIGMVVDFAQIENKRKCKVNAYDAFLCQIDDRTYLCWTLSPKTSCVIEFDAEAVQEDSIFRMAESVPSS